MKITILGSGGYTPTPLPNCHCKICNKARANPAFNRTGPSLYLNDLDLLVDLPAEAHFQIDKLKSFPKHITFSHWHPDHSEGWRTLQYFDNTPEVFIQKNSTISDRVPGIKFLSNNNKIKLTNWDINTPINSNGFEIKYFVLSTEIPVYGFILKDPNGHSAVIVPDHAKLLLDINRGLPLSPDLLIMNLGMVSTQSNETTLKDNVDIIKRMNPKKVFLTHIEANFDLGIPQIIDLQTSYSATISHDYQTIDL